MSSPYRHAVAALRERHDEIARALGETDAKLATLSTERMRLRIELDSLEERLEVVRRPSCSSLDASPPGPHATKDKRQRLTILATTGSVVAFSVATAFSEPERRPATIRCTDVPHLPCSVMKVAFPGEVERDLQWRAAH